MGMKSYDPNIVTLRVSSSLALNEIYFTRSESKESPTMASITLILQRQPLKAVGILLTELTEKCVLLSLLV